MKTQKSSCSCSDKAEMVVLSCSGASDLGELTDLVARKLRNNGLRSMKCLAMVAIDNKPLIENLKISNLLVIDGCPVDCAKKVVENAGLTDFAYLRLTDFGYKKGQTPANEHNIEEVYMLAATFV